MTTHLKSILGRLALLACLSLSLSSVAHASLPPASQTPVAAQQSVNTTLAWQRVGSPVRLHA